MRSGQHDAQPDISASVAPTLISDRTSHLRVPSETPPRPLGPLESSVKSYNRSKNEMHQSWLPLHSRVTLAAFLTDLSLRLPGGSPGRMLGTGAGWLARVLASQLLSDRAGSSKRNDNTRLSCPICASPSRRQEERSPSCVSPAWIPVGLGGPTCQHLSFTHPLPCQRSPTATHQSSWSRSGTYYLPPQTKQQTTRTSRISR